MKIEEIRRKNGQIDELERLMNIRRKYEDMVSGLENRTTPIMIHGSLQIPGGFSTPGEKLEVLYGYPIAIPCPVLVDSYTAMLTKLDGEIARLKADIESETN